MPLKVLISDKATKDLRAILNWYDNHSVDAADRFLNEVDKNVKKITAVSSQYKTVTVGVQRCLLTIFPYIIYFSQQPEGIVILRFRHKKQKKLKRFK
jgi:plasmid stabilization system protein ParE